jgi:phage shock protein A
VPAHDDERLIQPAEGSAGGRQPLAKSAPSEDELNSIVADAGNQAARVLEAALMRASTVQARAVAHEAEELQKSLDGLMQVLDAVAWEQKQLVERASQASQTVEQCRAIVHALKANAGGGTTTSSVQDFDPL